MLMLYYDLLAHGLDEYQIALLHSMPVQNLVHAQGMTMLTCFPFFVWQWSYGIKDKENTMKDGQSFWLKSFSGYFTSQWQNILFLCLIDVFTWIDIRAENLTSPSSVSFSEALFPRIALVTSLVESPAL